MTYATAYSEDQPPPKKGPVRQSVAANKAPSAAGKKQALSKKKQREVGGLCHSYPFMDTADKCRRKFQPSLILSHSSTGAISQ